VIKEQNVVIFHIILDRAAQIVNDVVRELEQFSDVQIWKVEGSMISVGKLPKIFKAIPVSEISYDNWWLTIRLHEKGFPTSHIFVVCEVKDELAVAGILKKALGPVGARIMVERRGGE